MSGEAANLRVSKEGISVGETFYLTKTYSKQMGEKAEFLLNESLISTAFFGGFWSAIKFNPESQLVHSLGKVLTILVGPDAANSYINAGELLLFVIFLLIIALTYVVGKKTAIISFVVMWLAGYLFLSKTEISILMMIVGWGLGTLAVILHTDEEINPQSSGKYRRYRGR